MDNPVIAAKKAYENTGGMFLGRDKPEEILPPSLADQGGASRLAREGLPERVAGRQEDRSVENEARGFL